jgi:hypothetical protein
MMGKKIGLEQLTDATIRFSLVQGINNSLYSSDIPQFSLRHSDTPIRFVMLLLELEFFRHQIRE